MDQLTSLLVTAQQGDRDALERFIALTHGDVQSLCRYLGDVDNADDLAQQTYERALRSLHRYRADGPAKHWLLTIARRTCADATRKRARLRRLRVRVMSQPVEAVAPYGEVGSIGELDEFLLGLDIDRRAAFVLTQINGLPYEEAAEILGVPVGTIRSRVSRARQQLVAELRRADVADTSTSTHIARRTVNEREPFGWSGRPHSL